MANAKIQEAVKDANRVVREKREAAFEVKRNGLKGKALKNLSANERDDLLLAIALKLGLVNDAGVIE